MTTNLVEQAMPLVLRRASPMGEQTNQHNHRFGAVEESLPIAVERRCDGALVHRDTYMTEVRRETTDDN